MNEDLPPGMDLLLAHTARFYAWERRGRGWEAYPHPVVLEPPFRPFEGHVVIPPYRRDDGRKPTALSILVDRFLGAGEAEPPEPTETLEPEEPRPWPDSSIAYLFHEYTVRVPKETPISPAVSAALLSSFSGASEPLAFEIAGTARTIEVRFGCRSPDRGVLVRQLQGAIPEVVVAPAKDRLWNTWADDGAGESLITEFGLAREFMLPLRSQRDFRPDPLTPLFAAMTELWEREIVILQVLFTPAREPWAPNILRAVTTGDGEPFFLDAPEVTTLAREKVREPLFAVSLRVAIRSPKTERAWSTLREIAGALAHFGSPGGNDLIPLSAEEGVDLEIDFFTRTTHRPGMLLALSELALLVHLPSESVRVRGLVRSGSRSKAPPAGLTREGVILGDAHDRGARVEVRLPDETRMRHVHIVGASGTGKSTLLIQLALQDISRGEGVGVLDPHGDLVDEIVSRLPKERLNDLLLLDPAEEGYTIGWNLLHAHSDAEKTLLASDLVAVFRRLSTSWGDQMTSVLGNAILAFLESDRGGTLLDLRRFLVDREFRAEFLQTVRDPEVGYYWQREFSLLKGTPQAPILTRLDFFLRPKPVRRIVAARENLLDLRRVVDDGKILLVKLAQGLIGEENATLLGSLLTASFHQAAMSRQGLAPSARRRFFLYLDEFHDLATPSMAALFTGARKYRLGLTVAHQDLRQIEAKDKEIMAAVVGNAATRIVFRVGDDDARDLARGFSFFTADDLVNLGTGEAVARVERSEHDFSLTTRSLEPLSPLTREAGLAEARAAMEERFGREEEPAKEPPPQPIPEPKAASARPSPPAAPARDAPPTPRQDLPAKPAAPAPLGRGGPEHQYLQELVKRWAEAKGYRAVIEAEVPEGHVDVALYAGDWSLACEISVTSTAEQEVGNVTKCLAAGFTLVAIVATKKKHLAALQKAVEERLSRGERERFLAVTPEDLFSYLESRIVPMPTETTVGGYRVKVNYRPPEPGERERKTKAVAEILGRSLRRLKGEKVD